MNEVPNEVNMQFQGKEILIDLTIFIFGFFFFFDKTDALSFRPELRLMNDEMFVAPF